MRAEILSKRYSSALLTIAEEKKALAETEKDVATLADLLSKSPDFTKVVTLPLISGAKKEKVLEGLKAKGYFSELTHKFLVLLARRGRLQYLPEIITSFQRIIFERKGVLLANAVFPYKADAETSAKLKEQLTKKFGKEIHLTTSEDASIMGGVVVTVGSQIYDASLRGKVERLKMLV